MSHWDSQAGAPIVCPSCKTRLRLSMDAKNPSFEFDCPECEVSLVARWDAATGVVVSAAKDQLSGEGPAHDDPTRPTRTLTAKHRTIAAALTASLGILLVISLASTEDSSSVNSIHDPTEGPGNAVGPGNAADQPHKESEVPGKSVVEVANAKESGEDAELVDTASQIAEQTNNDHVDSAEHPREAASSPPDELITMSDRDAVKLISAHDVALGLDLEASAVAQIASEAKSEAQPGGPQESFDSQPKQPTPKPMSVRDRLEFSIESFRQTNPVPLRDLIRTVEQMCRVRVDVSGVSPGPLSAEITLSLQDTTPADILSEAGRKAGLRAIVDESSVRMIPAED